MVHFAGRECHYVCGVSATEYADVVEGQGHFEFKTNPRESFTMYPEERLGVGIQSWLPWRVLHSTRGYCGSPGTVGTADGCCRVLWVLLLQGTVGIVSTARAKVTVGYCGSCW
jgi:hypothetical protein